MSHPERAFEELLERLDIQRGDVVYLHTSYSRLRYLGLSAEQLLEVLLGRLGSEGTLVLPSFAWNLDRTERPWKGYADYFRLRPVFDVRNTPTNIGLVPEVFRGMAGVRRSLSYWWPVCGKGRLAAELTEGQERVPHPYGPGSTFDRLRQHGVKVLGLGVSLNTSSLALIPDYVLGESHTHQVFTDEPQRGMVIDEHGRQLETMSYWLLPEAVRLIKPGALIEASATLRKKVHRADHGDTIHFSYPYTVYHDEALRLGRQACAAGRAVPWLLTYPLKQGRISHRQPHKRPIPTADFVSDNLPRWRTLLQELIRTPSTFEHEHDIVEKVAGHIEALGVPVERVAHDAQKLRRLKAAQPPISEVSGRHSIVAHIPGTHGGRSVAINTHLDVVPAGDATLWRHEPFSGHIEEDIIYGRGAMDDKAGVVISLALLEALAKGVVRPAGDVVFHYVLEDETTGNGTLLCLEAGYRADAAVIIDGTRRDRSINQHAGNVQFEVRLRGKPASVSVSHLGVNAAELMARLLVRLRDAVFALNEQRVEPWTRFPSPYQLVIHSVHSAGDQLTVPDVARAQCYVTFPPPFTLSKMRDFLRRQAEDFAAEHPLPSPPELVFEGFATEPVLSDTEHIEEVLQGSAARAGLGRIDVGPSTGTSDLRHFVEAGIPCLLYGPGAGFNPHRADERYHLNDLRPMILLYLDLIRTWCGSALPLRQSA